LYFVKSKLSHFFVHFEVTWCFHYWYFLESVLRFVLTVDSGVCDSNFCVRLIGRS